MRHRNDRDVHAREPADLVGVDASRVHDDLALDAALVCLDCLHAAVGEVDAAYPRLGEDRGAALTGSLGERQGELARVEVTVGGKQGRAVHALGRHRREELLGLLGRDEMKSGSPKVSAQAAWRCSSSIRSGDEARRSEPTSRQPVSSSTSSRRSRYSSTEFIIIRVRLSDQRNCPTRPAEWNVDPLVSWARSTSTTSFQPRRDSQYKIEQPPTPPPTTTTRARSIMVSAPPRVQVVDGGLSYSTGTAAPGRVHRW